MNSLMMLAALGGQLLSETDPQSLLDAQALVKDTLQQHIADPKLFKKAAVTLFKFGQSGSFERACCDQLIEDLVKAHYLDASSTRVPFSDGVSSMQYGYVIASDALRIFNLGHGNCHQVGWSGARAVFNAAALQQQLQSGLLSSRALDATCHDIYTTNPGIKRSIEYSIFRSKVNAVCSLLRRDQSKLDEAWALLNKDKPDTLKVLWHMQPDYFIRRTGLDFLRSYHVTNAISLLGKASHVALREVSAELVKVCIGILDAASLEKIDKMLHDMYTAIGVQRNVSDPDLKRFFLWKDDIKKYRSQIISLVLTGRPSSVGKQLAALCKADHVKVCGEKLRRELAHLDASPSRFKSKISDCILLVHKAVAENIVQAQDACCTKDDRLCVISGTINGCDCPWAKTALALFNSPDCEIDDVIDLLKKSSKRGILEALSMINESEHERIQMSSEKLRKDLEACRRENLAGMFRELEPLTTPQVQKAKKKLREKQRDGLQLETTLREELQLLQDIERDRMSAVFAKLDLECPKAGQSWYKEEGLFLEPAELQEALAKFKDPAIDEAIKVLEDAVTQEDALKALDAIRRIKIDTKDARALLESDHTNFESWSVADDCILAGEAIQGIRKNLPEENRIANPEHLLSLVRLPNLGLPRENVHILGDFKNAGQLLFDPTDAILPQQADLLGEGCESDEQKSERVANAIKKHFEEQYLDKDSAGAHHFICKVQRPFEHWVLVSLVKFAGKKPILVLRETQNCPVESHSQSFLVGSDTVLAFLYNTFMRQEGQIHGSSSTSGMSASRF